MKPMLDPDRDLKGATPETLARALLRQPNLGPRPAGKAVVGDQVAVEKVAPDEPGDGIAHLRKGFLSSGCCACRRTHERSDPYASG